VILAATSLLAMVSSPSNAATVQFGATPDGYVTVNWTLGDDPNSGAYYVAAIAVATSPQIDPGTGAFLRSNLVIFENVFDSRLIGSWTQTQAAIVFKLKPGIYYGQVQLWTRPPFGFQQYWSPAQEFVIPAPAPPSPPAEPPDRKPRITKPRFTLLSGGHRPRWRVALTICDEGRPRCACTSPRIGALRVRPTSGRSKAAVDSCARIVPPSLTLAVVWRSESLSRTFPTSLARSRRFGTSRNSLRPDRGRGAS
jgi:hypothetical protein